MSYSTSSGFASRRPSTALWLILTSFISNLHFYLPVFVFYLQHRGLTLAQVNALQFVPLLTITAFELPTGVFGDRFGRARSVMAGLICIGLSEAAMLIAHQFWHFILLQVVLGIGFAFISGSMTALLVERVPAGDAHDTTVKRQLGWLSAANRIGGVVSFAVAGWLFPDTAESRYFWPIIATAGMWLISAGLMGQVREPRPVLDQTHHEPHGHSTSWALIKSGWRDLRHNPALRRVVALSVFSNPLDFYWIVIFQPVLAQSSVPSAWYGPALAAGSLLAAAVEGNAERIERRLPQRYGLQMMLLVPAVLYVALALPHAPWLAIALFVLHKGTLYAANPLLSAYINAELSPQSRATALSMISLLSTAYQAAIGLPLGWLAERSLAAWCLTVAAIVALSTLILPIYRARRSTAP